MAVKIDPDDLPFDVPKFDEDAFVRKELISFKTTVVLFVYCLVAAGLTYAVWASTGIRFFALFVLAMTLAFGLRPAFKVLKIDVSHFARKEWIGTYLLYFFFWMGFTLLAFNPPFTDNSPPDVVVAVQPTVQGPGGTVTIAALVRDNSGLDESSVAFCLVLADTGPLPETYAQLSSPQQQACDRPWSKDSDGIWRHTWSETAQSEGKHRWFVTAADDRGRTAVRSGNLTIGRPLASISPPRENDQGVNTFETLGDQFLVIPSAELNLRMVHYAIDGVIYNMDYDQANERWFTDPRYPGWKEGSNVVSVTAVTFRQCLDQVCVDGVDVFQGDTDFTIGVDASTLVGGKEAPNVPDRHPINRVATPGPSPLASLAVVGMAAGAWSRRRK